MENIQHYYVNISAPNLVVICIDENDSEERTGRMYHCYSSEPRKFFSVVELIRIMEEFFDDIAYPQASTMTRYFQNTETVSYTHLYDDWIFRQLADIDNRNNIPDTSPQLDFNETDYQDYLKEKWNRGL